MKSYAIHGDAFTTWLMLLWLFEHCAGVGCHGNGQCTNKKMYDVGGRPAGEQDTQPEWVEGEIKKINNETFTIKQGSNRHSGGVSHLTVWCVLSLTDTNTFFTGRTDQALFIYSAPMDDERTFRFCLCVCRASTLICSQKCISVCSSVSPQHCIPSRHQSTLMLGAVKVHWSADLQHLLLVFVSIE